VEFSGRLLSRYPFTIIGLLALSAVRNARVARESAADLQRNLYAADVNLAQQALGEDNIARAQNLLAAYIPRHEEEDLRHLSGATCGAFHATRAAGRFSSRESVVSECARSHPMARSSPLRAATRWCASTTPRQYVSFPTLGAFDAPVITVAFSPDGKTLAVRRPGIDTLWDLASGARPAR